MAYWENFVLPFVVGTVVMFTVVLVKWAVWLKRLPDGDKQRVRSGVFSVSTLAACWEAVRECLLHRRIFRINPLLGYMHMSLALGWFLLIAVGWAEAASVLGSGTPLHAHVFFRRFDPGGGAGFNPFAFIMDLLLLFVLSGVALAWFKRLRSRALGMKRTTKHTLFDRMAMSALWFVFPLRLAAESFTAAIKHNGGFLTGSLGDMLAEAVRPSVLVGLNDAFWWLYSIALGVFFIAMPFSRYMHIFTEVPLIFLRRWKVRSGERPGSFDDFQIQACSRCGICIDACQLRSAAGIGGVQSVYFLRDRRYGTLAERTAANCLMCGRCESACPVGIELNALRLNSRVSMTDIPGEGRYDYVEGMDTSSGTGKVGYFAGCMTMLTPKILRAMDRIFDAAGERVWHADRDGGVCCGRPLKLSGELDASRRMMAHNERLFRGHGITTLVTSCPICLRVFREDYALDGIEVLHHTEYIERLLSEGRLKVAADEGKYVYHDPCELGRGCGIYEAPREVVRALGTLVEPAHARRDALCCGSSVADTVTDDEGQRLIGEAAAAELAATGAGTVVTACPLCKKALARGSETPVMDISEAVAEKLA